MHELLLEMGEGRLRGGGRIRGILRYKYYIIIHHELYQDFMVLFPTCKRIRIG